jgi:hypothetical protein
MSEQKRRDPRFDSDQKLWCEGQGAMAEARNMSRSGMFIVADDVLPVGEQLKVAFEGDEGRIEVNMEVMWSGAPSEPGKPGGMGVRIVSFDAGQKTYERFVKKKLEEQGVPTDDEEG